MILLITQIFRTFKVQRQESMHQMGAVLSEHTLQGELELLQVSKYFGDQIAVNTFNQHFAPHYG